MSILDLGYCHEATFRAGESGYISPRKRGTVEVWHDSKRYVYRLHGLCGARTFRQFIARAWQGDIYANGLKVTGKWPVYTVE